VAGYKKVFSFQLRLRYLLASAFITGLAFSSIVDAKAEENICYYSTTNEYKQCKKEKPLKKRVIKFPMKIGNYAKYTLWRYGSKPREHLQLNFKNEEKIEILAGTNIGPLIWSRYRGEHLVEIDTKNIYQWQKKFSRAVYPYWQGIDKYESYEIRFLDEYGKKNKIIFFRNLIRFTGDNIFSEMLNQVTNLSDRENRIDILLSEKLKNLERREAVIRSMIQVNDNKKEECININREKYPDLFRTYKKINAAINPLRADLKLGPTNTIKPICNKK